MNALLVTVPGLKRQMKLKNGSLAAIAGDGITSSVHVWQRPLQRKPNGNVTHAKESDILF